MKFRLFILVFLGAAATALIGALTMAAFLSFNLNRGFKDYLAARDAERMDTLVAEVLADARAPGAAAALHAGHLSLISLVSRRVNLPPAGMRPAPRRNADGRILAPPEALGPRLGIYDGRGKKLDGPPLPPSGTWPKGTLRRVLAIDGETIGTLTLLPRGRPPEGVDARFLSSQYKGAIGIALLLLVAGLVPAWLAARSGARLAAAFQNASDAIAQGDYTARAPASRIREVDIVGKDINAMAEALGRLEKARRRWLAEIAHELRTPLAALRGEVEAVSDGIRPLNNETLGSIREEVEHLGRLVDDLHQLAMADLDALPCLFAPTDAGELCRSALERFRRQAQHEQFSLQFERPEESLPVVWDTARIEQLLANLLSNSLRYTDTPGQVCLSLKQDGGTITICIDDSAPGVPASLRQNLFEPLFRLDEARGRASGGSGLGLAIARAIAHAHGGTIRAEESPLGGLRICLRLPHDASSNTRESI